MKRMKISLFLLGLLGYSLADRTFKRCESIADPKLSDKHQPSIDIINVEQDTHVILYHIIDLPKTNIPFHFNDQYDFKNEDLKLCTQDLIESGVCSAEEGFTLITDQNTELNDIIVNKIIKVGETFHYPIGNPGVFCAIGYHEFSSYKPPLSIIHSQPFGFITLEEHIFKNILYYFNFLCVGLSIIFIISKKLKEHNKFSTNTKNQYLTSTLVNILLISLSSFIININQYLVLMLKERRDIVNEGNTFYTWAIIQTILIINFAIRFVRSSDIYATCLNFRSSSEIKLDKSFHFFTVLVILYHLGTLLKDSGQLNTIGIESLKYPSGLIILGIIFKISKKPLNDNKLDMHYRLRFQKTRRLVMLTIIGAWIIRGIYKIVNKFIQSFKIGNININDISKLQYNQLKTILTLEETAKYDVLSVFINRIDYCAPLIIFIGSLIIWKGVRYDTLKESNGSIDQSTKKVEDLNNLDDNKISLDNLKARSQTNNINLDYI
ncbi:putative membrane protein [Wickerhamomyces ciferrii]|uniref:Membrane protein n=1 Tax=Wickerhamomyces ciferrii (strain ATCC 14091 / BCRC 22168 / CBS 111 / JCM 3599 / NBRC 0793 / NRRL Y-1031 F-60-10) TaxID=1206466 RepID=K0K918_WICCF|nr:uncharacterized protein BN7_909 [Wickerhamomyces ciferrii]CCH41370.1 putative membrane protein [Wickerhamomyces ciferrii]